MFFVVELIGLEPTTSSLRTKRSPKLSYSPEYTANSERYKLSPAFGEILKVAATQCVRGQLWDCSPITLENVRRNTQKNNDNFPSAIARG